MATVLEIANEAADDLGLAAIDTLFSDTPLTGARRLRRAITAVAQFLRSTYDWEHLKFDHTFTTIAQQLQPGALPDDLLSIVPGTMFDLTLGQDLLNADTNQEWNRAKAAACVSPRWRQVGSDLYILPATAGRKILFSYVSKAIGYSEAIALPVREAVNSTILTPDARWIIPRNVSVGIPVLTAGQYIEILPAEGFWSELNSQFVTSDGSDILPIDAIDSRDIITIVRDAAANRFMASFGQWMPETVSSINGQTVDPGKRYIVGKGQLLYIPVMRDQQWIEFAPQDFNWLSTNLRLVTRDGISIAFDADRWQHGIIRVTATEAGYSVTQPTHSSSDRPSRRLISEFSADLDVPLWDKELMTLGVIWRYNWRTNQPYNEDFRAFERMIYDRLKGEGSKGIISVRNQSSSADSRMAALRNMSIVLDDTP